MSGDSEIPTNARVFVNENDIGDFLGERDYSVGEDGCFMLDVTVSESESSNRLMSGKHTRVSVLR